jgi:hypothetical protein
MMLLPVERGLSDCRKSNYFNAQCLSVCPYACDSKNAEGIFIAFICECFINFCLCFLIMVKIRNVIYRHKFDFARVFNVAVKLVFTQFVEEKYELV